jgi:hypothetical protein
MPPDKLRGLVKGAITSLIDSYEWEKLKEIEEEERATLSATIVRFTGSEDGKNYDEREIPF